LSFAECNSFLHCLKQEVCLESLYVWLVVAAVEAAVVEVEWD
jgi:hypothetical protein